MTTGLGNLTLIKNGHVICPVSKLDERCDVLIDGNNIQRVGKLADVISEGTPLHVIDAQGAVVIPGLVDLAVHVREPGRGDEETLQQTLYSAAKGGFTSIVALASTNPACDGADDVEHRLRSSLPNSPQLFAAGALTMGAQGQQLAELSDMVDAGAVLLSDTPQVTDDASVLRSAMEYAADLHTPVLLSGFCPKLGFSGVLRESAVSTFLGLRGMPEEAEVLLVAKYIELSRLTGATTIIGPLSSARSVRLIERARDDGIDVFGLASVWHLLYDENDVLQRPYDVGFRLDPPLGNSQDKQALRDGVKAGFLAITSDHRPVSSRFKDVEFALAEPGNVSLPTCAALLFGSDTGLSPVEIVYATSTLPSKILRLENRGVINSGCRADICIVKKDEGCFVSENLLGISVHNTPLLGQHLTTRVSHCLIAGKRAAMD